MIAAISVVIDCKELKLAQTTQINQLFQFLNVICIHDQVVYGLSPTLLMSKNVNNDVTMNPHICTEHQSSMEQQETQHQTDVEALQKKHDDELKALQVRFNEELTSERAKLEEEKEADLARLQEALRGNLSQQQELQLQMLKEHHDRELEAVREELVRTHMEKFTEMTAQLEAEHGVCLLFVYMCR